MGIVDLRSILSSLLTHSDNWHDLPCILCMVFLCVNSINLVQFNQPASSECIYNLLHSTIKTWYVQLHAGCFNHHFLMLLCTNPEARTSCAQSILCSHPPACCCAVDLNTIFKVLYIVDGGSCVEHGWTYYVSMIKEWRHGWTSTTFFLTSTQNILTIWAKKFNCMYSKQLPSRLTRI